MAILNQHTGISQCFGATFYDVFIQSEFSFAQMLSTAELARFHSSLNSAAEDSIQESMLSGFFGKFILVDCENISDQRGEKVLVTCVVIIPFDLTYLR